MTSGGGGLLQQLRHAFSRLGPLAQPELHARHVDLEFLFLGGRQRIVESNAFDVVAVERATTVRDDDAVIRALVRAATGQTYCHHSCFLFTFKTRSDRTRPCKVCERARFYP